MAGISSLSAALSGLPVLSDSNLANAAPSASMRSARRSSNAARSFGTVCAQPADAASAAATAAFTWAGEASGTSAMHRPVAGSNMRSTGPSPATNTPSINNRVCMSAHLRPLLLVHIVEGQSVRRRGTLDVLAANLEPGPVDRDRDIEAGGGHGLPGQARPHGHRPPRCPGRGPRD